MENKQIFVVAGNRRQFEDWVRQNVVFINRPYDVNGRSPKEVHLVGNYYDIPEIHYIMDCIHAVLEKEPQKSVKLKAKVKKVKIQLESLDSSRKLKL